MRVSVITGLALVTIFLSTMILAVAGVGERDNSGGHRTDQPMEMDTDDTGGNHGSGDRGSRDDSRSGADHGTSDGQNSDHDSGEDGE